MENNNTHAITTPNTRPPTALDELKQQLAKDYQKQITNYFAGDKEKALKFMSAVIYSVQKTPKLLECTRESILHAAMSCAEFQLYPSNVSGEAYLIPYKGKAQFQLGYQGLITLFSRAGINVNSHIVRKNDTFEYEEGLTPKLIHKFSPFANEKERGEPVGVYAVLTNSLGQKVASVMGREDVMKIKNLSQAKDSEYSPWNSKQDPSLWMWKKTAIKQAGKLMPKTEVLQKAIAEDNEDSIIVKNTLDASGPAVGTALHAPEAPKPEAIEKAENEIANEEE
jgi:recombination protein RecT